MKNLNVAALRFALAAIAGAAIALAAPPALSSAALPQTAQPDQEEPAKQSDEQPDQQPEPAPGPDEQIPPTLAAGHTLGMKAEGVRRALAVAPVVVICPDEVSYLEALRQWSPALRFP